MLITTNLGECSKEMEVLEWQWIIIRNFHPKLN